MSLKNNIHYDDSYIKEILFSTKSIAIVGLSDKENRPSNFAAKYLKNRGYKIIPINPVTNKKTILGEKVYKTISELEFIPDMVDLFVKKEKILFDLNELYMSQNYSKRHITEALERVKIFDNHINALKKSSVTVVITEWDNFKNIEWEKLINENNCPDIIFDGRNFLYDTVKKIKNIKYFKL